MVFGSEHESEQPVSVVSDEEYWAIFALAEVFFVWNPGPYDFAWVGVAVEFWGIVGGYFSTVVTWVLVG